MGETEPCPSCGQPLPETEEITLVEERNTILYRGRPIKMIPPAFEVFKFLLQRKNRVVSKDVLYDLLFWRRAEAEEPEPKIVDVYICKLRRALEPHGLEIETIWGVGVCLKLPHKVTS
jgi:DNA-binding response OmpR family regulator